MKQPALWISLTLVPLIYITVGAVLGLIGAGGFSVEIQAAVVTAVVSGGLGAITGFWLGETYAGSKQKEEK